MVGCKVTLGNAEEKIVSFGFNFDNVGSWHNIPPRFLMLLFYTKNAIITRKNIVGGYFYYFVIK